MKRWPARIEMSWLHGTSLSQSPCSVRCASASSRMIRGTSIISFPRVRVERKPSACTVSVTTRYIRSSPMPNSPRSFPRSRPSWKILRCRHLSTGSGTSLRVFQILQRNHSSHSVEAANSNRRVSRLKANAAMGATRLKKRILTFTTGAFDVEVRL